MVNFKDLQGISPQANASQTAYMQALQTAVAGELDLRGQKMGLLKQGIASGAPLLGDYLERKSKRDQSKKEIERNKEYGNQVADYLGLPSISEVDKFQGLEFSEGAGEAPSVNDQGQYQLGAKAIPPIDPQKLALSKMIRAGNFSPKDISELDQMLAYGDEITPRGIKDKYTALDTKSEYESLEGAPGTGTTRRTVAKDVGIDKGRADIANVYDTINKRVAGGAGGASGDKASKKIEGLANALGVYTKTLDDINKNAPNIVQRATGAAANLLKIPTKAGVQMKSLHGLRTRLRIEIARLDEVGNLTKDEQESAEEMLPNPLDTIEQQQNDLRILIDYLEAKSATPLNLRGSRGGQSSNQGSQPSQAPSKPVTGWQGEL